MSRVVRGIGGLVGRLFGSSPEEAPVAPEPDEQAAQIQKERDAQRRFQRSGRAGSVLTGQNGIGSKLG